MWIQEENDTISRESWYKLYRIPFIRLGSDNSLSSVSITIPYCFHTVNIILLTLSHTTTPIYSIQIFYYCFIIFDTVKLILPSYTYIKNNQII